MGIKLSQLPFADTVTATLFFDSDGCHPVRKGATRPKDAFQVEYRPRFYTRDYERRWNEARTKDGVGASTIAQFLQMIASWDVEGDDGKPIPLTTEELDKLNTRMLNEILNACFEDMNPDPTTSGS